MAGQANPTKTDIKTIIQQALAAYSAGGGGAGVGQSLVYLGDTGATKTITLKRGGKTIKAPTPNVKTIQQVITEYLTNPKIQADWRQNMQKYGLEVGNPIAERKVFEAAVTGASDWYTTSNGKQKVTPKQYLQWYAGGQAKSQTKTENIPTRQIYAVGTDRIASDINDIALKTLGRQIQEADKSAEWYKDLVKGINKLYQQGVVTETKQVKNPKTGKMETVVTQTPGYSSEQITGKITGALQGADPEALARKQRIDFTKFLFGQGGQQG